MSAGEVPCAIYWRTMYIERSAAARYAGLKPRPYSEWRKSNSTTPGSLAVIGIRINAIPEVSERLEQLNDLSRHCDHQCRALYLFDQRPIDPFATTILGHQIWIQLGLARDLGPIDIHCIQIIAAARWMKPVKLSVRLS